MGTQGTGRKRSTKKERSTAEDDALNLIAREAEARLAAKRAARAEAREIRMKELERQQKEIFQVQKKYYGLDTKSDDRADTKWGDIEQWMEDSERYSRSSRIQTLSDDDERMSVGSRGSVRSDLDAVGAYGGGDSNKKSKKKKKHKHKDKDRNGCDDDYSVVSGRSSRLSDESRASRSSRLDLTSSRLSDDTRGSRASRLDLQPASYASSDLYSFNGLSSSRNPGSAFNGYQFCRSLSQISQQLYRRSSLYEDGLSGGSQRAPSSSSRPLEYTSYRSSGSRVSSRAGSARASPVEHGGSVASFLRSAAGSGGLHRDLDDVTIPDFSDVEDRDYLEKGSRAASALTAATLTSVGGTSSRRGSGETALTIDAETSIREIKEIHELKDQIQDVESKYTQNLKEAKDALVEVEEKYRKAMVSNAQLDNEKNNLMYQVDTLKDSLMELEELLSESRRGYEEKVKEHEREKHAHTVLQFQFTEMKETLKQSEELLNDIRQLRIKQEGFVREVSDLQETVEWKDKKIGALERQKEYTDAIRVERDELREETVKLKDILKKHGIVLGPDLNINGEIGEAEVDGSPSAEPATQPAQDSQTAPTEGNSMLGNTEETPLRSSGEEEVDPEQHREMFEEEKENHASCDALCNVDGVFTLETSSEEQPTEEQTLCLDEDKKMATEEHNVEDGVLSKDLNVDIIDQSITEAKDIIICSPELQAIVTSSEENVPETQAPKGGDLGETSNPDLGETSNPDLGETETKSSSVDTQSNDIRESCNNQENKQEDEESNLQNTESCHQQKVAHGVMTESLPDESDPAVSNPEPQQEPENAEEAENDEAEEISGKSQPQGAAAAAGKKKKRKRKGKKKGGTHDDKNQQRDGTDQEKGKKEIKESATRNKGPTAEPELDSSATETLKKSRVDQEEGVETFSTNETLKGSAVELVTEEHDNKEKLETENVEEAEPVATPKEERLDHVTDEQNKRLSSETETVKAVEAVAPADTLPHVETLNSRTNARKDEQDEEHTLETEKVEEVGSITSPVPETNPSTSDLIDNSKGAESIDGLDREGSSSIDNSKSETDISATDNVIHKESEIVDSVEDEVGSIDEMQSECTTSNPESSKENTEESHVPSNGDIAADESESTSNPESKDSASVSKFFIDVFTNALKSLSGSEPSAAVDSGSGDASIEVSGGGPEEATETVRDDEVPGAETEQEAFPPDGEDSELKSDRTEKEELNGDLRDAEDLVESDRSHDENTTDAFDSVKSLVETVGVAQAEQLGNVQSQDPTDESNAEVSSETEKINTIDMLITPDSPKEATGIGSSTEQDHRAEESAVEEDPEHKDSQKDPNDPNETEQLHEPGKDKSEDDGSSQPTLQDSDEEDGEEDEGHSFDFNDMDVEEAIATSLLENPSQEEVEEGVEVMPDERNNISSSNESRPDEPVESAVDGGNQVESLDTAPPDNLNSGEDASPEEGERVENVLETQKNIPEEEVGVSDEPGHIAEEGELLSVGEVRAVAEDIVQAASVLVEEGLDAIKLELQGGDSPKRAEQVASSKDPQQTGKDVKKNSKKGKGKGKEECKMS
ncbi:dentin sialophosphoprotein isoform X3 [Cebidichthys violaceus]|uniref:dentin sialophosphoprotein isoform X3 n=1 Tax=Cebidichthys violaceus TaxID=271503 RepID=UPI0035CB32F2